MTGYDFHPKALADLDSIGDFIAQDSIAAAERVVGDILAGVRKLVISPHQGHSRTDLTSRPQRFWRVRDYFIVYAPDEEPLWVIAVIHGRRSPRVMAATLRGREASALTLLPAHQIRNRAGIKRQPHSDGSSNRRCHIRPAKILSLK